MGQRCDKGACVQSTTCSAGLTVCTFQNGGQGCVNFQTDPGHCGNCMTACQQNQLCVAGHCVDYDPAAPCTTCPCNDACEAAFGNEATCCAGFSANTAICVDGNVTCP